MFFLPSPPFFTLQATPTKLTSWTLAGHPTRGLTIAKLCLKGCGFPWKLCITLIARFQKMRHKSIPSSRQLYLGVYTGWRDSVQLIRLRVRWQVVTTAASLFRFMVKFLTIWVLRHQMLNLQKNGKFLRNGAAPCCNFDARPISMSFVFRLGNSISLDCGARTLKPACNRMSTKALLSVHGYIHTA